MHFIYLLRVWEEIERVMRQETTQDKAVENSHIYGRKDRRGSTRGQMEREDPGRGLTRDFK